MTGIGWRLFAISSLIFIIGSIIASTFVAPAFLRGQDAAGDRLPLLAPISTAGPMPLRYSPPIAPVWIPPPRLPESYPSGRYPVSRYPVVTGAVIFRQMVRAAGIIFSGRVTSIGREPTSPGNARASTTITFQVEHAIRGTSPGRSLTIHEWAGLWTSGERYCVGEHVALFLYSPGKLGLTSPVAGGIGRFAMDSQGRIVLSTRQVAALADDPILGGKTVIPYADFIQAERRSGGEE